MGTDVIGNFGPQLRVSFWKVSFDSLVSIPIRKVACAEAPEGCLSQCCLALRSLLFRMHSAC